ncbi:MAG: hypothetical protein GY861_24135 [bacterium]|nr:hypothetical protein [bacterium]
MGKYLLLWELVPAQVPVDPKERAAGWSAFMDIIKQDMKEGTTKDWGAFVSEGKGYAVAEGTEVEILKHTQKFVPFVTFQTHPIASVSQIEEMIASI